MFHRGGGGQWTARPAFASWAVAPGYRERQDGLAHRSRAVVRRSRWTVTALPAVGQLVYSRAGRDANRAFVVVGVCDDRHVLVIDGQVRPTTHPKRKNVRHLTPGSARYPDVAAGRMPSNAELHRWLRSMAGGAAAPSSGSEEGRA